MVSEINFDEFIESLDKKLEIYFDKQKDYINCKAGCSDCCKVGDYPVTYFELIYLMKGFATLSTEDKLNVQNNIKNMIKGGACPFLLNDICSVYSYRPIICRIHGLAYLCKDNKVKVPFCVNNGKNFSEVYSNGEISVEPIKENLDKYLSLDVTKNLYDWIHDRF